ncbi:MAG: AarF/ABC1/UbiB kinase family protein [Chitinophagales bacterium]|nr:AarF/ABC1/UbiB kinase family protein [Bacteroidota bacterium]MCB9042810.1 AarF/ABC1/UbiB kinase family protein [Chitinophagales bacterium]
MSIGQTIKNLNRGREIIQILLKYGFEEVVINTPLKNFIPQNKRLNWLGKEKPVFEYTRWERIRMAAEELGPTFIKFAQVLSSRPDILPEGLIKEFEKFQDKAPFFDSATAKNIIESETGKNIDETFEYFLDRPIAAASIGQVHRAKLLSGEEVVVKVRRPGIGKIIDTDLSIIKEVVQRGDAFFKRNGITNLETFVLTFEKIMHRELNYVYEARNMQMFRQFYHHQTHLYIPEVFRSLCSERVLVSEYINACKISDTDTISSWGLQPEKIAENGMDIYLSQIFEYGFFHADPHPGNVLVQTNGNICLIDFGMVAKLTKREKFAIAQIFLAISQQDAQQLANNLLKLAVSHKVIDKISFENELNEIIQDIAMLNVQESNLSNAGLRFQKIIYRNAIELPGSVFLILRAIAILEGIGKQIHPNFNVYEHLLPYGKKMIVEQFSAQNIINTLSNRLYEWDELLQKIPPDVGNILSQIRQGKLLLKTENPHQEEQIKTFNNAINRLTQGFIIASLIIAGALLLNNTEGFQFVGILCLVLAFLSGTFLYFSLWRSNDRADH